MITNQQLVPKELELPYRFHRWWPDQAESVDLIVSSGQKVYLLDAPTGSGKSLVAIASHKRLTIMDEVMQRMKSDDRPFRCVYLTRTIQLQQQILKQFDAAMITGRSHYPCSLRAADFPKVTAEDCPKGDCGQSCEYKNRKIYATKAPLCVLNDAYYLAEVNGPAGFKGANLVVLDEIDSLEAVMMDFVQFQVSERQLKKYGLHPPENMESLHDWILWADQAGHHVMQGAELLQKQLPLDFNTWSDVDLDIRKEITRAQRFTEQMVIFLTEANDTWILDLGQNKYGWQVTFKPVTVGPYCEKYLWRHGMRFLGMSGTILDPEILADDLGIEEYGYRRLDSTFPVHNRLIRYRPVANLKYKDMDTELPKLADEIASIITAYPGQNVLIHTVSNSIRDYLMTALPLRKIPPDILMTHETDTRSSQLEIFKISQGKIMISPSFDRGVDLPDDECRVVIIAKMPYLNLQDKQVKARMALPRGQRWYNLRAIQSVMQMAGRAVRSPKDWCHTIILDRQFDSLLARTKPLLPKWWLDSIVREDEINK